MQTIAWATDGSPSAHNALSSAKHLAHLTGARLLVLHVQELGIARAGFGTTTWSLRSIISSINCAKREATRCWQQANPRQGCGLPALRSRCRADNQGIPLRFHTLSN